MKILTYNVRSWYRDIKPGRRNWKRRAARIKEAIEAYGPDVLLLQEAIWPMTYKCIPEGYVKASGCSISHHVFVKEGFAEVEANEWHIHWTRARLRLPDASRYEMVSVHGRWEEAKIKRLAQDLKAIPLNGAKLIAGGDWNVDANEIRTELFPIEVRSRNSITFRNWKTGKAARLDYFAGSDMGECQPSRLITASGDIDSDHYPQKIETK